MFSWKWLHCQAVGVLVCSLLWIHANAGNVQGFASGHHGDGVNNTLNLGIMIPWSRAGGWALGESMGSAAGLAVRALNDQDFFADYGGYNVSWEWADSRCEAHLGMKAAVDLWAAHHDLDALIGGGCSDVCEPVALLSSAWNLPYVSFGCTSHALSNKITYPTFSRSVGTWLSLAPMFDKFTDQFQWNRVGIISSTSHIMQLTSQGIRTRLISSGKTVISYSIETTVTVSGDQIVPILENLDKMRRIMHQIKKETRIIILLMLDDDIRNVLIAAVDEGMIDGDYQFIVLDASATKWEGNYRASDAQRAYEGLISGNVRVPTAPEWKTFAQDVIWEFQNESKFDNIQQLHLPVTATVKEVDVHAGMLYDAIFMWAHGVKRNLAAGGAVDDGITITQQLLDFQFQGITGYVVIDGNGDRKPDYSLRIINNGNFITLMDYFGLNERLDKVYHAGSIEWTGITWSGGSLNPPKDSPPCGWNNECNNKNKTVLIAVLTSVALLLIFGVLAALYIHRKIQYEKELHTIKLWHVEWADIFHSKLVHQQAMMRDALRTTKTYASLADEKDVFTDIAQYKGKLVAVKRVAKSNINVEDRELLIEMKAMREMKHDNINLFMGACTEIPHICYLMAYGHKGSLQDVLQNDSININWDFKMSLANDIAKGMSYLHRSSFGSHGHLTSSNCIIDKRWICKITDYGMGIFKTGEELHAKQLKSSYLLWTAPELLRLYDIPKYGTPEGDAFSYGIILQEIVLKDAPYAQQAEHMTSEDIVDLVKAGENPPFRPEIPKNSCGKDWKLLMQDCWHEDQDERPYFSTILKRLRTINGNRSVNVIDNVIHMMEQQTDFLEEVLSERTHELNSERKHVEMLLYNMLPKSIAQCLTKGDEVEPEAFEKVTVYFSDIAGFTSLAAASDPMQMVSLLNDLYCCFDEVSEKYDVYKVETIGDAHMVVSGLPVRNGNRHAAEIASMALDLLSSVKDFTISHLSGQQLQLRIGIHSGSAVAGVVGVKMPKYCVFGDTINAASHMESLSAALHIHVSQMTASLLDQIGGFHLKLRGSHVVKSLGEIKTFWLVGKDGFDQTFPVRV